MRRSPLLLAAFAALLSLAPPAAAAGGDAAAPVAQTAQTGSLDVAIDGGLTTNGRRYADRGQRLTVTGTVRPYTAGQTAVVEISRAGHTVATERVAVAPGSGGNGTFTVHFTPGMKGRFVATARVENGDGSTAAGPAQAGVQVTAFRAHRGSTGVKVRLLKKGLRRLGYAVSGGGRFDGATARAVLAFRKVNRMGRRTGAKRAVFKKVFRGRGTFNLKYPRAGKHVEFDWSRQVLVLARRGRPERIYHASSGKSSTPTVFGSFRFYRRQWGTNAKGMVHSVYFIRGYAIHGYQSVPTYPASHGCIRVPIPSARSIARWISLGDRIFVYR